jgi:hypothetical protein
MSVHTDVGECMNTRDFSSTLTTLLGELVDGASPDGAFMLNRGDVGLLRSLDKLTAQEASAAARGGASIAAHVDHLRYGLSLMNRWSAGEHPFDSADWSASWRKTVVSDAQWKALRTDLAAEAHRWLDTLRVPRDISPLELTGVVGSIAHLGYHLGAIRQINAATRGPAEPAHAQ